MGTRDAKMMNTKELLEELKKRGIKVEIGGCGCCDSPWVRFVIDGKEVFNLDRANMNSIDDER